MSFTLTPDQERAMDLLLHSTRNLFISGQAGTGKSFLIKQYIAKISRGNLRCALTSTTGVSALLIGGKTIHSYLGLGLGKHDAAVLERMIRKNKTVLTRWKQIDVLIIDEISMLDAELFSKINIIAGNIRKEYFRPFGGIRMILMGDFLQLPSVKGTCFLFETELWQFMDLCVVHLTTNMRQTNDPVYSRILSEIRRGKITKETKSVLRSRLISRLKPDDGADGHTSEGLSPTGVYSDGTIQINGITPTRIFCTNRDVERINREEFMKLSTPILEHTAQVARNPLYKKKITDEELLGKSCFPNMHKVYLREGAQVMLIRNLDVSEGLVNGSRGVVKRILGKTVHVQFLTHPNVIPIEPMGVSVCDETSDVELIGGVTQYPLRLAYAATVHKLQGCTLDMAIMNLRNVFEFSQAYVALSRVKSLDALFLEDVSFSRIKAHPDPLRYYEELEAEQSAEQAEQAAEQAEQAEQAAEQAEQPTTEPVDPAERVEQPTTGSL